MHTKIALSLPLEDFRMRNWRPYIGRTTVCAVSQQCFPIRLRASSYQQRLRHGYPLLPPWSVTRNCIPSPAAGRRERCLFVRWRMPSWESEFASIIFTRRYTKKTAVPRRSAGVVSVKIIHFKCLLPRRVQIKKDKICVCNSIFSSFWKRNKKPNW